MVDFYYVVYVVASDSIGGVVIRLEMQAIKGAIFFFLLKAHGSLQGFAVKNRF